MQDWHIGCVQDACVNSAGLFSDVLRLRTSEGFFVCECVWRGGGINVRMHL